MLPTFIIKVKKDPTSNIMNKVNEMIGIYVRKGYINNDTAKSLKSYNSVAQKFHGLPKIHKINNPMRLLTSFTGSPLYTSFKIC